MPMDPKETKVVNEPGEPVPVTIDSSVPVPVTMATTSPIPVKMEAPRQTVAQEDETAIRSAGQRRINILWESTQAVIALVVTGTGMYTASMLALRTDIADSSKSMAITAFLLISNTVFLVIGFYFGRTNHSRTGGIGGGSVSTDR